MLASPYAYCCAFSCSVTAVRRERQVVPYMLNAFRTAVYFLPKSYFSSKCFTPTSGVRSLWGGLMARL